MAAALLDVGWFAAGAALLVALVRWWQPAPGRRAAVAYALLTFAFFAQPLATPGVQVATDVAYGSRPWSETVAGPVTAANPLLVDPILQILPFRELARDKLLALAPPLWTHEIGTGQPLLGNAQSAPFAPLHLLALPLAPIRALTVAAAWQVLLGLLLMHALARRLGAPPEGAALAAVAWALSAFSVVWLYYPMGMAAMWLPGVLLGLVALRERVAGAPARGAFAGLVASTVGMALSGHPETVAHAAMVAGVVGAAMAIRMPPRTVLRFVGLGAGAAALSFALAAPALLPVLETVPESQRAVALEANPDGIDGPPPRPLYLLVLLDPFVFGSPRDGNYQGPANFNELNSGYAGVVALVLALAAAVALRGRFAWILLGAAVALAAAFWWDPLLDLLKALPVVGQGAHGRLRLVWVLGVALAAGLGVRRLGEGRVRPWVATVLLAAAVAALALVPALGQAEPQRLWRGVALAGIAVVALCFALPRLRPWAGRAAVAALVLDLFVFGVRYNPVMAPEHDLAAPPVLARLAELAADRPVRMIAEQGELLPNLPALFGLWDPRGNDPMRPHLASMFVAGVLQGERAVEVVPLLQRPHPDPAGLEALGVAWLLTRHHRRVPPPWRSAFEDQGGRVWHNPRALGLFFVPPRVIPAPGLGEALAVVAGVEDLRRDVVVETPPVAGAQGGRVEIEEVTANGFRLRVAAPAPLVVASSVSHAPGWRVRREGQPAPALRAQGAFLAFAVPAGEHRVEVEYAPASWRWGLVLCGLGLVAVAVLAVRGRRRRRPTPSAAPPPAAR
ncbi:MAG TPA: hypothetical protein VHQ65_02810 [Thermoanaerobaculia bacterium]|nr:hypothetical protein [Thermoanaerobaculia bacterium]